MATTKVISGSVPCSGVWQCAIITTSWFCPSEKPGRQHPNTISHSITLSWYWASYTLPYPNNAEQQGNNKYQVYMSMVWLKRELNFQSPAREACALAIRPLRRVPVMKIWKLGLCLLYDWDRFFFLFCGLCHSIATVYQLYFGDMISELRRRLLQTQTHTI